MSTMHTVSHSSDVRPFTAPTVTAEPNPRAHGGVERIDTCLCGAQRRTLLNGVHAEYGNWDPIWHDVNPHACVFSPKRARAYLKTVVESPLGLQALVAICGPAVAEELRRRPDGGDDVSSLQLARTVHSAIRGTTRAMAERRSHGS